MIKLHNIKKIYGDRTVLDIENLTFPKGETVAIVGPNGSGKSTLLKIIADTVKTYNGSIERNGKILYLPQQNIPFRKSVRKNILFSMEKSENKDKRCDDILLKLALSHLADKNAKGLSGGEAQRLSLGRILVNDSDFLLLDEPTSATDIEGAELVEKALTEYRERTGCGIIMTTHSPAQALKLADRIIMLCDGKIAEDGNPEDLLKNPETEWGRKFISMWTI